MGLDLKTPLRNLVTVGWEPNDIPFMGWTTHEKDDLGVFIPLYPIPLSYSSTKKIYRLGYIGGNTINLLSMTERNPPLNVRWVLLLSSLPPRLDDDVFSFWEISCAARDSLIICVPSEPSSWLVGVVRVLSQAFWAWSVVKVSWEHPRSGVTAVSTMAELAIKEQSLCPLSSPWLSSAGNEQSKPNGGKAWKNWFSQLIKKAST